MFELPKENKNKKRKLKGRRGKGREKKIDCSKDSLKWLYRAKKARGLSLVPCNSFVFDVIGKTFSRELRNTNVSWNVVTVFLPGFQTPETGASQDYYT